MTPESIAKELGLKYIGKNTLLEDCPECDGWKMISEAMTDSGFQEYCDSCNTDGKVEVTLYQFTDSETGTTIATYELSELESKLKESRKKFKTEV